MTVEHEPVGVVVIEEQDQFEVGRILGEVVGNLAAQGLIALDASAGVDLLYEDIAIGKIEDTI